MRLIDADELLKLIPHEEVCSRFVVANAPTIQPERKKGKWMVGPDGRLHCSRCLENPTNRVMIDGRLVYDMTPIMGKMKFCPNCGAKIEVSSDE